MSGERQAEEVRKVASYRRAVKTGGGYFTSPVESDPIDWEANMKDLATRIATLQSAQAKVIVSVSDDAITLSTTVHVPAPAPVAPLVVPPAVPAPIAKATKAAKVKK